MHAGIYAVNAVTVGMKGIETKFVTGDEINDQTGANTQR
jgi:hypothetical protein